MKPIFIAASLLVSLAPSLAQAHDIQRISASANSPILAGVAIPEHADWLVLSGQVPPAVNPAGPADAIATYGDTRQQAIGTFQKIEALLKAQGYALSDVVKLTVFLVGDPALGGKLDFKGFNEAYSQFFGTQAQPNKTARSVVQVVALANPAFLVEIEAVAAKTSVAHPSVAQAGASHRH
jgi:2-iminobutanoate/2-iminopropanoate deaminase